MKKLIIVLTAWFALTATANAMSYEQARQQALFLTDKMAYELNLTEQQYEAAYEVNLDYLMSVNTYDDLYGAYWTHRNLDLSYILFDWQYRAFCAATYFYRPLYWDAGYWHFAIYARYPHRDYFYFGRPHFWTVYRGGHAWHHNGGRSWYHGRDFGHHAYHGGNHHFGMRDGFKRGDYKHGFGNGRNGNHGGNKGYGHNNGISPQGGNTPNQGHSVNSNNRMGFGGTRNMPGRESSTRKTVTAPGTNTRMGGANSGSMTSQPSRLQTAPARTGSRMSESKGSISTNRFGSSSISRPSGSSMSTRGGSSYSRPSGSSFGGSRSMGSSSGSRGSFGGSRGSSGGGRFGGHR